MTRVFAVHARPATRLRVARALEGTDLDLVGQGSSADEARRIVSALSPQALTVDALLPDADGISLAQDLRRMLPALGVVVLGPPRGRELALRALDAGLSAYLPENATGSELAAALRHSTTASHTFSAIHLATLLRRSGRPGRRPGLSQREQLVLHMTRQGLGVAAIAARLLVSESTVRTYISRVQGKLDRPAAPPSLRVRDMIREAATGRICQRS